MKSFLSLFQLRGAFALIACVIVGLTIPNQAFAAGTVKWKSTTIKEREGGSWKVELEIHFPKAPDVGQIPMKFEFVKTAYYERSLVNGNDKPVERTIPLSNQLPTIESVDVGFYDPGTATIQARTRFDLILKRKNGYAGEYKVKIKDARTDQTVGQPATVKLTGENEIIDRREISFEPSTSKKKKKEKEEKEKAEADAKAAEQKAAEPKQDESSAPAPAAANAPTPKDEGSAPPAVEERPGGGCHMGHHGEQLPWLAVGLALGLFAVLRRRA